LWYRHYRDTYQPVILESKAANGELVGLWLLAFNPSTRDLVHAGANQAEYHAWLASPRHQTEFLSAAWTELGRQLPFRTLRFRYLPTRSLVDSLRNVASIRSCMSARAWPKPVLRLDPDEVRATLALKKNKTRFTRIRKLGALEFRRIRTSSELGEVFNDIIAYYDLRQGAVNDATPFGSDPARRPFHLALLDLAPDMMHVTVTLLNGRVIAAFLGLITGKIFHLEILAHSPLVAKHSPGKLHVMLLSELLVSEGIEALDLTPGGDPWKERFATTHEEAADVTLYRSGRARRAAESAGFVLEWGKRIAARGGLRPQHVRRTWGAMQPASAVSAGRRVRAWIRSTREVRVYRCDRPLASSLPHDPRVLRNSIADLVRAGSGRSRRPTRADLLAILDRLEHGESSFTITIDGRVAHSAWLVEDANEWVLGNGNPPVAMPAGSVALYDFTSHSSPDGDGALRALICHALRTVSEEAPTGLLYVSLSSNDPSARRVVESLGLHYQGSLHWKRRMGLETTWADPGLATPRLTR
jgi:CelD/BcsL family acetyltransferase involved in cellulose biosynthesis